MKSNNAESSKLPRNSEIFVLAAENSQQLQKKVHELIHYIDTALEAVGVPNLEAANLSYSLTQELSELTDTKYRIAAVADSVVELKEKLLQVSRAAVFAGGTAGGVTGAYSGGPAAPRKLAFMLPGLGSAYPDMLLDLCLHYPEVREVFDYVDGLALAEGEKTLPSTLLFPGTGRGADNLVGTAMLAVMDSAVVTVLMAEWAIFMMLDKFGIKPDALIGCSTGEFAALTMGGVADIAAAARMFYRLSVSVARSLPRERLLNLVSMKVDAGIDAVKSIINRLHADDIYITAEFTPRHSIVTGSRDAVTGAMELLKEQKIEFHQLPVAIPYHTPLVKGFVSAQRDEVAKFPLSAPEIPIWSCATATTYGADTEVIRHATTELFAKPILFERTIKAAYESGINTFIEVGPRDNLASFAEEIFAVVSDALAGTAGGASAAAQVKILRSDVMGRSSLTQLNNLLAELFCLGCDINFDVLFENRQVQLIRRNRAAVPSLSPLPSLPGGAPTPEQIVISYMEELASFHRRLLEVQSKVFNEYLAGK